MPYYIFRIFAAAFTLFGATSLYASTIDVGFLTLIKDDVEGVQYFQIDLGSPSISDPLALSQTILTVDYFSFDALNQLNVPGTTIRETLDLFDSGISATPTEWILPLSWILTSVRFSGVLSPESFALTAPGFFFSDGNVTGSNFNPFEEPFTILSVSTAATSEVPEPSYTALLLMVGSAALLYRRRQ